MRIHKLLLLSLSVLLLASGCSLGNSSSFVSNTENDPLLEMVSKPVKNTLKADFITPIGVSPIIINESKLTEEHKKCIASTSSTSISKRVEGRHDKEVNKAPAGMTKDVAIDTIKPVFIHAVDKYNINWKTTSLGDGKFDYSFIVGEGDEVFWYCYFKHNDMFKYFLSDVSIKDGKTTDKSTLILNKTQYTTKDDPLLALIKEGRILLDWNADENAISYEIEYYLASSPDQKKQVSSTLPTKYISGLQMEQKYIFKVRSVYADGTKGNYSDPLEGIFLLEE